MEVSHITIGSVVMQLTKSNWYYPVYYTSRKLSAVVHNYSTTEREALGMIYSVNKFLGERAGVSPLTTTLGTRRKHDSQHDKVRALRTTTS